MDGTLRYHEEELGIASNPSDPRHCMPAIGAGERSVLDVGCGIGQLFAAPGTPPGLLAAGVDIDRDALHFGAARSSAIRFVAAGAEALPFRDGSFDLVVSRVSLPYTDVPAALREMARVLRPGGRVWISLHPFGSAVRRLGRALVRLRAREAVFLCYVLLNGLLLCLAGRVVPFRGARRMESVQTAAGMRRLLSAAGFSGIEADRGRHFVMTARLRPGKGAA
jgi:SAM-dependent methyltransferase